MKPASNTPVISVGILKRDKISFTLDGEFRSSSPGLQTQSTQCEYVAYPAGTGIAVEPIGQLPFVVQEIAFHPADQHCSFIIKNVTIGLQFHWERSEDQHFVGALKLVRDGDAIVAINIVDIESYLTSVISSEMSADCSLGLLKAHTVTARSWLLAQLEKSRSLKSGRARYQTSFETDHERIRWYDREDHALFDVCADDHCQRYQGITKAYTESVTQAVESTRGEVVTFNGLVCDARFSKSCGGVTELFENTWEPVHHPYLTKVADGELASPQASLDLTREEDATQWIRTSPDAFCNTNDVLILKKNIAQF